MNMLTSSELNRRDWYLNQLGITQYELRKPKALNESVTLALTESTRLIIVVENTPPQTRFFQDILSAVSVDKHALCFINPAQLALLPTTFKGVIWSIGCDKQSTLSTQYETIIETSSLETLQSSAKEKRQLWQKLCEYEHYFQA
ncbi:DNA polymerase III subunit psi [Utexia brackfieldae]|uniref:DNA polymerase III subunit psi n=1 Tax=Utexia brackfieldae TaxID=3074108 RepID=UPI00370DBE59